MANELNQIFQYNGSPISFQKGNSVMVNATQMAKPFYKSPKDFLKTEQSKRYIDALSEVKKILSSDLVKVVYGDNGGTWMHEDVALEFARWLSPSFAIWCNDRIKELLQYGMTATQPTLEQMINNPDLVIHLATQLKSEREEKARIEAENQQKEAEIAKLQPKANFADKVFDTDNKVDIGQAAKILRLGFGRNTLFKKLREKGIFFSNRNEPKQRYIDAGYFEVKEQFIERDNHPGFCVMKVLINQKGLAFINRLLSGNPSDGKQMKII